LLIAVQFIEYEISESPMAFLVLKPTTASGLLIDHRFKTLRAIFIRQVKRHTHKTDVDRLLVRFEFYYISDIIVVT